MITKVESSMLESVLKCGLHIILDKEYLSFGNALKVASLKSLCHRRKELFFNFSEKTLKNPRFSNGFPPLIGLFPQPKTLKAHIELFSLNYTSSHEIIPQMDTHAFDLEMLLKEVPFWKSSKKKVYQCNLTSKRKCGI